MDYKFIAFTTSVMIMKHVVPMTTTEPYKITGIFHWRRKESVLFGSTKTLKTSSFDTHGTIATVTPDVILAK